MLTAFRDQFKDADDDLARQVLSTYDQVVTNSSLSRPAGACGFSGAVIWQVHTDQHAYALRRWPPDGLPAGRLRALHHFLKHLHQSGVTEVPLPLANRQGETLADAYGSLWQVEPWMPGVADFHAAPSDARLASAMRVLARLHRAAAEYDCRADGCFWFARVAAAPSPACSERRQLISRWSNARCTDAVRCVQADPCAEFRELAGSILHCFCIAYRTVDCELQAMESVPVRLHPCLRDLWHDHLLFTGDELTGLVDPSAARTESVAADLSRLLGSLVGDAAGRWDDALSIYRQVRPLTLEESRLIQTLDRSSVLLSGLTWIERRRSGRLEDSDLTRVLPRLRTILARLQHLV